MATNNSTPVSLKTKRTLERFSDYLFARAGLAPSTVTLTLGFVRRMQPDIGLRPSRDEIYRYVADLRRSGISYSHLSNTVKAITHFMEFNGRPVQFQLPKKPQHPAVHTLSEGKIAILIEATTTLRDRAIVAVLAYSGMRNAELISLRVKDIDMTAQTITVQEGKGAKGRITYVAGECMELLSEYLHELHRYAERRGAPWELRLATPEDCLFVVERKGHQIQQQDIRKLLKRIAKRTRIKTRVWPHLFRHSHATALLKNGANVYSIQAQLGHSDVSTTMEYYLHPNAKIVAADIHRSMPSYM